MTTPNKFRLSVNVQISNEAWDAPSVQINEEVQVPQLNFKEMAEIFEAFHTLIEKFREK